ncbi:Cytochrome c subfamily, putative [Synechococcus sp. PCC 7335]|uniref:c-type cytochrome n=1 Tax=Synechococcus sp. (strain ATCC 29403 / PCC 7335) TaxID=91464 RepID=UPI00017EC77C|nr:c-type cytochrome [Synechococcus sp. PCC 7335]EDX85261.1 Cytochrome c subfamily, putative [Synechococcus sp. PCC 7335]
MAVFLNFVRAYLTNACLVYLSAIQTRHARCKARRTDCTLPPLRSCRSLAVMSGLLFWLAIAPPTLASPTTTTAAATAPGPTAVTGAVLFTENCAACHANGGNIIRRGKNLKQRAMKRNGYGDISAIVSIVTQGKGIMPAYAEKLSADEISAIAQYVHEQSDAGW